MAIFKLTLIVQNEQRTENWFMSKQFERPVLPRLNEVIAIAGLGFEVTNVDHLLDKGEYEVMCDIAVDEAATVFLSDRFNWEFGGEGFSFHRRSFLLEILGRISDEEFLLKAIRNLPKMEDFAIRISDD